MIGILSVVIFITLIFLIVKFRHEIMIFIRGNGSVRVILFIPLWFIASQLFASIGATPAMIKGLEESIVRNWSAEYGTVNQEAFANYMQAWQDSIDFASVDMIMIGLGTVLGAFLAIWFMMAIVNREPLTNIGLSIENRGKEMLVGLVGALVFIGAIFFVLWLVGAITITGIFEFKSEVFIVSIVLFLFAFHEEIVFRGYVLKNMMDDTDNRWISLAGSSLFFALIHSNNPNVLSTWVPMTELFAAGFILGISYTFTKNLWFPTFFHFGWNFFQGLFGFKISGIDIDSWKAFSHENSGQVPDIISGGSFGIEGSVISLTLTILGTYGIYKYYTDGQQ